MLDLLNSVFLNIVHFTEIFYQDVLVLMAASVIVGILNFLHWRIIRW